MCGRGQFRIGAVLRPTPGIIRLLDRQQKNHSMEVITGDGSPRGFHTVPVVSSYFLMEIKFPIAVCEVSHFLPFSSAAYAMRLHEDLFR
jgi:hypothetical protein